MNYYCLVYIVKSFIVTSKLECWICWSLSCQNSCHLYFEFVCSEVNIAALPKYKSKKYSYNNAMQRKNCQRHNLTERVERNFNSNVNIKLKHEEHTLLTLISYGYLLCLNKCLCKMLAYCVECVTLPLVTFYGMNGHKMARAPSYTSHGCA